MSTETISFVFKNAVQKSQASMDHPADLSEDEFINTYNSDPFFRERINVEIEKLSSKLAKAGLKPVSKCLNE